jgi:hypothetical protein
MDVLSVYFVFVLSLRGADRPSKEPYRLCKHQEAEEVAKAQQEDIEP